MGDKKILLIGNGLENTGTSKAIRYIIQDFSRFAKVKLFPTWENFPLIPEYGKYSSLITKDVKEFDSRLVVTWYPGMHPSKHFSWLWFYEFLQFPEEVRPVIEGVKNTLVCTEKQANLLKEKFEGSILKYRPYLIAPQNVIPLVEKSSKYVFYSIADLNPRKHLLESLVCYFTAFSSRDKVVFYVKIPKGTRELFENSLRSMIARSCFSTRTNLPEVKIDDNIYSDEQIWSLHQASDCYVALSYGEGLNLSACEAALMGKPVIYNEGIAPYEEYFEPWFPEGKVPSFLEPGTEINQPGYTCFAPNVERMVPNKAYVTNKMREFYKASITPSTRFEMKSNAQEVINAICD